MKRRIGILTAGGDCPGLNAAIRGVAKAAYEMFDETEIVEVGAYRLYYPGAADKSFCVRRQISSPPERRSRRAAWL